MRRLSTLIPILCVGLAAAILLGRPQGSPPYDAPASSSPFGHAALAGAVGGSGGPAEQLPPAPPLLPDPGPDRIDIGPAGPAVARVVELRLRRDLTLYDALLAEGVRHEDIMTLVRQVRPFRDLRRVRAGEVFRLELSAAGDLSAFGFDLDLESWVRYERDGDGDFGQTLGSYPVERRVVGVHGTIATSLYESLQACGAPLELAAKMNDILGWDLDFTRDPRRDDAFRIVFEEIYKDGEFVRTGAILSCDYQGAGRQLGAYRFTLQDGTVGYFDRDGRNLQKQLMRAPLNYSRISSGFSYNRRHPVLGRNMPHLAIDYAAPVGTPVWAAGDGTIAAMGYDKANGRYVRLRHTNREYETYYLHFSRFARGLKVGQRVRQGEVIGYVGATGYATGPHLDFRVKKGGQFVNPRTLKLPPAEPVPDAELASFRILCLAYDAALKELGAARGEPVVVTALEPGAPPSWQDVLQPAGAALPPLLDAAN